MQQELTACAHGDHGADPPTPALAPQLRVFTISRNMFRHILAERWCLMLWRHHQQPGEAVPTGLGGQTTRFPTFSPRALGRFTSLKMLVSLAPTSHFSQMRCKNQPLDMFKLMLLWRPLSIMFASCCPTCQSCPSRVQRLSTNASKTVEGIFTTPKIVAPS